MRTISGSITNGEVNGYLEPDQLLVTVKDRLWSILYKIPHNRLRYSTRLMAKRHQSQLANLVCSRHRLEIQEDGYQEVMRISTNTNKEILQTSSTSKEN